MRSLVSAYDAYLSRLARRDARDRMFAFQAVLAPWGAGAFSAVIASRLFGQPLLAVLAALLLLGSIWACARFNAHGAGFDRTPVAAPWVETPHGQALVRALGRVTLSSLSAVTLQTRLRADLHFSGKDRFELAKILAAPGQLDALADKLGQDADIAVGGVLDAVAAQSRVEGAESTEDLQERET